MRLASKLNVKVEEVIEAKKLSKNISQEPINHTDLENESVSEIKEFSEHLNKLGLKEDEVKSVKFWQTQKGDVRYSIVTKTDSEVLPDLEEVIKSINSNITPIPIVLPETNSDKTLVVFLSDKHIGALTKEESLYNNNYNASTFRERMYLVMDEIAGAYYANGVFKKIVVIDLGDAMDGYNGETTRGGHKLPQNMSNKEAFEVFIDTHKSFYSSLFHSEFAGDYEVYHVTNSNHGGDFEHFATRCLQEYLKASFKDFKIEVFDKFITPICIDKHTYLLSHGKDTEDMKSGLPLVLDGKTEQYILNYILHQQIPTNNLHFVKGDLHQASTQWGKHFRYRNVPSVYGSSKWIMTNFGYTKPGCSFDLIEGNDIKQWELWF